MHIGHIKLSAAGDSDGRHFAELVASLQRLGLSQFVIVRSEELAQRLKIIEGVTVAPIVHSAVTAYSLMPNVDVVHIHDRSGWPAGLLLTLTKSIPFVLTDSNNAAKGNNPITRAAHKRAKHVIPPDVEGANAHLAIYRRIADTLRIPTMLL